MRVAALSVWVADLSSGERDLPGGGDGRPGPVRLPLSRSVGADAPTVTAMGERVLVVGGTGPTGLPLVRNLVADGHDVTILHRGLHEHDDTPDVVHHLHADPYDVESMRNCLDGLTFDATIVMYGRLRRIAELMVGRTGRFLSVGGVPAYRGWMNPWLHEPNGLPVPVAEDAPTADVPTDDEKGYRIARTEEAVFAAHPGAAHFRYPYVYGPHQLTPREWCVVRRVLDGRRRMIVADGGLTLHHHGYTENLAHAVTLAVRQPDAAAGKLFNVGDSEVLTVHQVIELICAELDHEMEIFSLPFELALPARPMLAQPSPTHRVLDLARITNDLGYRDLVPARVAVGRAARWLVEHPPALGGTEEMVLTDPFDYAAEDALMDGWRACVAAMPTVEFAVQPGPGLAYSGPGGRPRSQKEFVP
ncbi:MAG: Epimerase [Ilumatobacteraceae bacterium]|nr:Epimerase [Ilumatobacteraceae bacterium]